MSQNTKFLLLKKLIIYRVFLFLTWYWALQSGRRHRTLRSNDIDRPHSAHACIKNVSL